MLTSTIKACNGMRNISWLNFSFKLLCISGMCYEENVNIVGIGREFHADEVVHCLQLSLGHRGWSIGEIMIWMRDETVAPVNNTDSGWHKITSRPLWSLADQMWNKIQFEANHRTLVPWQSKWTLQICLSELWASGMLEFRNHMGPINTCLWIGFKAYFSTHFP